MKTNTRIRPAPQAPKRDIPSPTAAGYLAIYDSQDLVATYVERDGSHFLFDSSGVLVGSFKSRAAALAALPKVSR